MVDHGVPPEDFEQPFERWWHSDEPELPRLSFDQLDNLDRGIIRLLRRDGRISNAKMARELNTSQPTIRSRISRMTEGGIVKVAAILNPHAHGYECDILLGIRCQPGTAESIAEGVSNLRYVLYAGHTTGTYDLVLDVLFRSDRELYEFLHNELHVMPGVVSVDVMHVMKAGRVDFDWSSAMDPAERRISVSETDTPTNTEKK